MKINDLGKYRILDANVNRVAEGIRVIEDIARFDLEDKKLTDKLRNIRHILRKNFQNLDKKFILARDSAHDIGKEISNLNDNDKKLDEIQIILANFKRVTEGLRVIEEITKLIDYKKSKIIENIRYESYYLEKEFNLKIFKNTKKKIPKGIYGITAENFSNGRSNIECVKEMIKAGIKIIQYREKNKTINEKSREAYEIAKICKENNVIFIVNDHIEIAMLVDADGVHLGQEDLDIKSARKILGENKIIGISTHAIEEAQKAKKDGADYIGVGPIFPTTTKDRKAVGLEYLKYIVNNIDIPFVAIGGIKEHNIDKILNIGAYSISLVSEIVGADNIIKKVKIINEKIEKYNNFNK
ncbi:thiamine-phosphate diphosphorylase [Hypnocyclicus thermotrophus]|uniref:Thiamine-phosphate synthase n=1 Tax=Hypnocyclicus thermotrophus TaxID=1627895 RepID=A0AA46DZQ1_9FUSO|nr:thiamine phosphate synthase [Hypnocyclicus thermotrophus]TDT71978.1 thiamine-phosphate diphosphorylase [Hypnocyclicus thermotrophus]